MRLIALSDIAAVSGGLIGAPSGPNGIAQFLSEGGQSCSFADAQLTDPFFATNVSSGGSWGGDYAPANGYASLNTTGLVMSLGAVGAGLVTTLTYAPVVNAIGAIGAVGFGAGTYNSLGGDGRLGVQEGLWDGVGTAP